jgi:sugar/nucleoside kinase (ribokinase family)
VPKVISIGNTCLDIILLHTEHLPNWSTEVFFGEARWRSAGQGANFAIASASLGNPTFLVSNTGSDAAAGRIEADLRRLKGLDIRFLRKIEGPTGFTVSVVRSDGERLFLTFLGHQDAFSTKPDQEQIIQTAKAEDMIHISGYYMLPRLRDELLPLLHKLRGRDARISFDPGWPPSGFSKSEIENVKAILPHVQYFEPNETELFAMTSKHNITSAVKKVRRWFSGVLAVKRGYKGSVIFVENKPLIARAFKIRPLDTTGAGDVFDAAFLTTIMNKEPIEVCARRGNAAAAMLIMKTDSDLSRFPTETALNSFLRSQES